MDKEVLKGMINIYKALKTEDKYQLAQRQLNLIQNTIEQSGDGKSEETAICVINPADQLSMIFRLEKGSDFNQEIKQLSNKSILWIYSSGNSKIFVKLVGGYYQANLRFRHQIIPKPFYIVDFVLFFVSLWFKLYCKEF
jgi:hypothetical protein